MLRRSCSLFLFEVFLSAFKISFSGRPFFFLGVEVWPEPSVFSPALGSVDSSLGSGQSCSWVPSTGIGTGTRTGTWVRVPTCRYGYGYQAGLKYGYGYNEMGMGTSTGTKPC